MKRLDDEEGSGTIAVIAVVLVASLLAAVVLVWAMATAYRSKLQMVADFSALAGADVSATAQWEEVGSRPCQSATEVARRSGVEVAQCWVSGVDTYVIVELDYEVAGFDIGLSARARAGVDVD
ncbi:Rv3654c family TadE-like protein [Schaalia vaccimaxillae]|uniref:Rv3654c family TadE-like protein n=1 Tax=Schaalia vaccimaxillae TaxID=183916 RepID=UPI0003B5DD28|nr:Rv3654c family TadE-like protein [Schaalia vaccimaxillae]